MVLQRVSIDYISLSMPVFLTYFAIGLQPQVSICSTTKFYIVFLCNHVITSNLNNPLPIKYRTKVQRVSLMSSVQVCNDCFDLPWPRISNKER